MRNHRKMKNKQNVSSPKDNSSLKIELKGMDFSDLAGKEFKIAVLKKLKSATRKLSPMKWEKAFMNKMRYLSKRNHISQRESLELKNSMSKMKKKKQ